MSKGLFASLYQAGNPFALIDPRERRDHVDGHWFGSTNVPLSVLASQIARLVPDRGFPIHLLDWQDRASNAAYRRLRQLGYRNVTRCPTGLPDGWGHGFVKGEYVWSKAFGEVVAHALTLPEAGPDDYLADPQDYLLFDVRPTAEYRQFTIPGSQSLPNSLLLANMPTLRDTGRGALLHCAGRTRSIIGACTLRAAGYDGPFAIFRGGTQAWQLAGHEREHGADRVFAGEKDSRHDTLAFLRRWNIPFEDLDHADMRAFTGKHGASHRFDVSDDAASGQAAGHGIVRISGTNLIQQTDRSLARYHVPVILFDVGSGSRAAFAAFWLRMMGFQVRVVFLQTALDPRDDASGEGTGQAGGTARCVSADELVRHRDQGRAVLDFRPSRDFRKSCLTGSQWHNIGLLLSGDAGGPVPAHLTPANPIPAAPVVIIGSDIAHAEDTAALLSAEGWNVEGIFVWDAARLDVARLDPAEFVAGRVDAPVDESTLFAGRHHGNMQDSRDYLAWEEALPAQIDAPVHEQWLTLLGDLRDV